MAFEGGGGFNPQFIDVPDGQPSEIQNFINMTTAYMGDKARAEQAEEKTLMQSMANNNRLYPATKDDPNSFEWGGQRLKIGAKPVSGTDIWNKKKAQMFNETTAAEAWTKAYNASLAAMDEEEVAVAKADSAYENIYNKMQSANPRVEKGGGMVKPPVVNPYKGKDSVEDATAMEMSQYGDPVRSKIPGWDANMAKQIRKLHTVQGMSPKDIAALLKARDIQNPQKYVDAALRGMR